MEQDYSFISEQEKDRIIDLIGRFQSIVVEIYNRSRVPGPFQIKKDLESIDLFEKELNETQQIPNLEDLF